MGSAANLAVVGTGGCDSGAHANQHYKLTANIALIGAWTPIDLIGITADYAVFDGNGKTISGLWVTTGNSGGNNAGLFGRLSEASVSNLTINSTGISGTNYVGALAGRADSVNVDQVKVNLTGTVAGIWYVGGLFGALTSNTSRLSNTYVKSSGSVSGNLWLGGIAGSVSDTSIIENVAATINVTGTQNVGGIAGVIDSITGSMTLKQAFYSGTLTTGTRVGGFVGGLASGVTGNLFIENSAVRGDVRVTGHASEPAPFIGYTANNSVTVNYLNSYVTGRFRYDFSTTPTDIATVVPHQGSALTIRTGLVFETTTGVNQTSADFAASSAFNTVAAVPGSWSLWQKDTNYRSSGVDWVIDTVGSLNNNRPMPAGVYNLGFFGTIDYSCLPGTFSATGLAPCDPSIVGTYVAGYGATAAINCPPGKYAAAAGLQACVDAPIGTFINSTGAAAATPCLAGYTTLVVGSIACVAIVTPVVPYTGPLVTSVQTKTFATGEVVLPGDNLSGISSVKIDSVNVPFEIRDKNLVLHIPAGVTVGVKSISITSTSGLITVEGALNITEKPIDFATSFGRVKNKVTATISSPTNLILKLNGAEVASQRGSGTIRKVMTLKKGKNYVDVFKNGVLEKRALFTVK